MTNARPNEVGTGAVMPGRHSQATAARGRKSRDAGCPTLHVELYRNTARLIGPRVPPLLDLAGVTARMYDRAEGCWAVPAQYADDVICAAEYQQGRFATVAEVDR